MSKGLKKTALLSTLVGVVNAGVKCAQARNMGEPYTFKNGVTDFCWGTGVTFVGSVAIRYSLYSILNPKNTVVYTLYDGDKPVYPGITYAYRIGQRCKEHQRDGKKFTRMVIHDIGVIPRVDARELEQHEIQRFKELGFELYNVQHNR